MISISPKFSNKHTAHSKISVTHILIDSLQGLLRAAVRAKSQGAVVTEKS